MKLRSMGTNRVGVGSVYLLACLILGALRSCNGGISSSYARSNSISADMPLNSDVFAVPPGYNSPQQVHITQGDHEGKGVIISWVTPDEPGSSEVIYWAENSELKKTRSRNRCHLQVLQLQLTVHPSLHHQEP